MTFNQDKADVYLEQHREILNIIDAIIEEIGMEKTMETISLFTQVSTIANNILNERNYNT